jgi:hypothetical protein
MATALEELRKESADLSARTTRFAITSLAIIAVTSLTFARALRNVDSTEVSSLVDKVGTMIFAHDPGADDLRQIHATIDKLSAAFTVELPVGGLKMQVNLIYWSSLIPFLILASCAYLAIARAKQMALQTIAVSRIRAGDEATPLDRLTFGVDAPSAYALYPSRLGTFLYTGILICLAINVLAALLSSVSLVLAIGLLEFLRHLIIVSFYFWCVTKAVQRRILAEAATIAGSAPPARRKRLEKLREWMVARARRGWRLLTLGGSALSISTLFVMTAATTTCSHQRKGMQLFLGQEGAVWPPVDDFWCKPIYRIDSLGRWVYITAIVFATIAALIAIATLTPAVTTRLARRWLWDAFRGLAVTILFFVVCEFGFVWVAVIGLPALIPPAWQLVYWVVPSSLYVWMTVVRKQKWAEKWSRDVCPVVKALYAPAWIVAPLALAGTNAGSALFAAGAVCLASAFVYALAPIGVNEEAAAPLGLAPSFHDQLA